MQLLTPLRRHLPGPPVQFGTPTTNANVQPGYGYTGTGALIENDIYYFHPDHLGSTSYLTNKQGNVSQHVEYIPFGEIMIENHLNNQNNPYLYNGKELDVETGFYYYGARYYEPKSSLWLSVDPLAEKYPGFSPYAYVFNNPVMFVDLTGMQGEVVNFDGPGHPPKKLNLNKSYKKIPFTQAQDNIKPVDKIQKRPKRNPQSFEATVANVDASASALQTVQLGKSAFTVPEKTPVWEGGLEVNIDYAIYGLALSTPSAGVDIQIGKIYMEKATNGSVTNTIKNEQSMSIEIQVISPVGLGYGYTETTADSYSMRVGGLSVGTPGGSVAGYDSNNAFINVYTTIPIDSAKRAERMKQLDPTNVSAINYMNRHKK